MAEPIRAGFYALTDRGRTRDHNEDTFLVADLARGDASRDSGLTQFDVGERGVLYVVADGMGGAAAGELASEMAATSIHRHLMETWHRDTELSEERFAGRLREAVEVANQELHGYAREHPEVRGMGTTATVVGVLGARLVLAQIGDSRGYLVRNGEARQLTRDQSLTQRLVEVGELTEEEAEQSERRNIILQALGPDPRVMVDLSAQSLQQGDVLIMCSDGLSTMVRRDDLAQLVQQEIDVEKLCHRLVDLANERGGPDNITVIAVRFDGAGLPAAIPDEPGYHELTTAERPALRPTASFPAATIPLAPADTPPAATPKILTIIGLAMAIIAAALLLLR